MSAPKTPLLAEPQPDGGAILRAPKLGLWSDRPENGAGVFPGSPGGPLTQLRHRFALVVPDGVAGRVAYAAGSEAAPVEFGQPLFRVTPFVEGEARVDPKRSVAPSVPGGALEVTAPTDGVFYRAPALGAAPYVACGDRIREGQPVGLIEVMKTFNPIAYAGTGLPQEARVVEILATDGQEVRAGQALVRLKVI